MSLKNGINNTLWSEILLAMTHIMNLWSTLILENSISPIEI